MALSKLILVLGGAAIVIAALTLWYHKGSFMPPFADHSQRTVQIGDTTVQAEVVSTVASREQGLSGRDSLAQNTAMLFVFTQDGVWGFWMKDMNFPIDIVWLGAGGGVVTIAPNVSPDTYPQILYPTAPARYVLELPAGFAAAHQLAEGQTIVL